MPSRFLLQLSIKLFLKESPSRLSQGVVSPLKNERSIDEHEETNRIELNNNI